MIFTFRIMNIEIKQIAFDGAEHKKEIELRYKVLRQPLGLNYTQEQLDALQAALTKGEKRVTFADINLEKARALADLRAGQLPADFWFTDRSERPSVMLPIAFIRQDHFLLRLRREISSAK